MFEDRKSETTDWQPIETAPKDGREVTVRFRFVSDKKWQPPVRAAWRTVPKPALHDPLTGECFADARDLTGWLYVNRPYRVPGILEWRHG